jgi:hypothetical protein
MRCIDCQEELALGDKFCRGCGTAITLKKVELLADAADGETVPRLPNALSGHTTRFAQARADADAHDPEPAETHREEENEQGSAAPRPRRRASSPTPAHAGAPGWRWGIVFLFGHALSMAAVVVLALRLSSSPPPAPVSVAAPQPPPPAANASADATAEHAQFVTHDKLREVQNEQREWHNALMTQLTQLRNMEVARRSERQRQEAADVQKGSSKSKPAEQAKTPLPRRTDSREARGRRAGQARAEQAAAQRGNRNQRGRVRGDH